MPEPAEDHVYLAGHAPLSDYLKFMSEEALDARGANTGALAGEWRAASDRVAELRESEAGWADEPPVGPVPESLAPLVALVRADPIFQRAFAALPADLGVVELDRLVVTQRLVSVEHARRLHRQWGGVPPAGRLLRICLPFEHKVPACRFGRVPKKDEVVFVSPSNDVRFLETVLLGPDELPGYRPPGPVAGVVALVVGFGSNYLNVIAAEGRLVLANGYHRAYALRALGLSHAPCVVQRLSRRDELSAVGQGVLRRDPDAYLKGPRPPVLKDFFDPLLGREVRLEPRARQVRVTFSVEESLVPRA